MGRKKKRGKKRGLGAKGTVLAAQDELPELRKMAERHGLVVVCNMLRCPNGARTTHIMFNDAASGRRVLNFWPGTGRYNNNQTGEKLENGVAANPGEALRKAVEYQQRYEASVEYLSKRHLNDI